MVGLSHAVHTYQVPGKSCTHPPAFGSRPGSRSPTPRRDMHAFTCTVSAWCASNGEQLECWRVVQRGPLASLTSAAECESIGGANDGNVAWHESLASCCCSIRVEQQLLRSLRSGDHTGTAAEHERLLLLADRSHRIARVTLESKRVVFESHERQVACWPSRDCRCELQHREPI